MKTALIALLVFACSATAWAGAPPTNLPGIAAPDGGASVLLLSMGVAALGLLRRSGR